MSGIENHFFMVSGGAGSLGFQGFRAWLAPGIKVTGMHNYQDYLGMGRILSKIESIG